MQGSLDFPDEQFKKVPCKVGTGELLPFIDKEEAEDVVQSCYNPNGLNIVTCQHPAKDAFVTEVGGMELNTILTSSFINNIPTYFPTIDIASRDITIPGEFIGITLHDLVSSAVKQKAGMLHEQENISFRKDIFTSDVYKGKKIIVFLTGADTLIEWIWYNRKECNIFQVLKNMGVYAAGTFNFSVIKGECAFSHALNLKKSLLSGKLIEEAGLIAIPHVYAVNKYQIERWKKWFAINPGVKCFTMNCQLQKKAIDRRQVVDTVCSILKEFPYLNAILQGFPISQIEDFGNVITRISFTDKKSVKYAQCRKKLQFTSNALTKENTNLRNIPNLIKNNIAATKAYVDYIKNRNKLKSQKRA